MNISPVILFVYNRPWHTQQTVEALQKCELASESDLYIFADGPKENASIESLNDIYKVRQYIHTIEGFKNIHIIESPTNRGLAESIIYGVTQVIDIYKNAIVLEDDIVTHPLFLRFMNDALSTYYFDDRIYMIGAYSYNVKIPFFYKKNVYLSPRYCSWGWATWENRWTQADWDVNNYTLLTSKEKKTNEIEKFNTGSSDLFPLLKRQQHKEIDSWAIRWQYCMYIHNGYTIQPVFSLTSNIGFDGTGVHCPSQLNSTTKASSKKVPRKIVLVSPSKIKINRSIINNYKKTQDGFHSPTIKERLNHFLHKHFHK